jgi:hypothetical protein
MGGACVPSMTHLRGASGSGIFGTDFCGMLPIRNNSAPHHEFCVAPSTFQFKSAEKEN